MYDDKPVNPTLPFYISYILPTSLSSSASFTSRGLLTRDLFHVCLK